MIDSHSHIYSDAFDADRQQVVERALQAGVTHVVLPNENLASLTRIRQMKLDYPQFVSMSIGLHPEEINADFREQLSAMNAILEQQHKQFVAIITPLYSCSICVGDSAGASLNRQSSTTLASISSPSWSGNSTVTLANRRP